MPKELGIIPETAEQFYLRTIPEVKGDGIPATAERCETVIEAITVLLLFHFSSDAGFVALVNWRHEVIQKYRALGGNTK